MAKYNYYIKAGEESKHKVDIINVFHNLGRSESEAIVLQMTAYLKGKDIQKIKEFMEIGLSNKEEI